VGCLKVGVSYLHVATVQEESTRDCRRLARDFKPYELSLLEGEVILTEVILTDTALSAPVFRHDRHSLIGSAEARGRRWQLAAPTIQPRQFSWIVGPFGNSRSITPPQFSRNTRGCPRVPN
jgi:hypothetical protein